MKIALTGLVVCLLLSLLLALAVSTDDHALVRFDQDVADVLHTRTSPALIDGFKGLAWFGSTGLWSMSVIMGVWLAWRRRWLDLLAGVLIVGGGALLQSESKELFARARPVWDDPIITLHTFAFPSGHAMMAVLICGYLVILTWDTIKSRRTRAALVIGAVTLIGLIGFSRLYLGVHFLTDVLGGYTISGAWLSLCLIGKMVLSARHEEEKILCDE